VCCFSCERTNLVVFLSLFSKMFSMAFYSFLFPLFGLWNCICLWILYTLFTLCPFKTKRGSVFYFGLGMYFSVQISRLWSQIPCIRLDIPVNHPNYVVILSRLPSVSKSFELFKVAFVRTSQQHIRTPFSVRQVKGFPSQTQIWEDSCNRLDGMYTPSECYPW
jgi:hypothetical protein